MSCECGTLSYAFFMVDFRYRVVAGYQQMLICRYHITFLGSIMLPFSDFICKGTHPNAILKMSPHDDGSV